MKTQMIRASWAIALGVVSIACSKSNERQAVAPTHVPRESNDIELPEAEPQTASTAIAQSRCVREQRCDNIGATRTYTSFSDCETTIESDWREDLNARECSGGIDHTQLSECMTAIRTEGCGSPFDSLERMAACTQAEICYD